MIETYLIPTVLTADNKFPMEYKVVTRKRDMRTKFCKKHESNIIDRYTLDEFNKNHNIIVKGDRVIMKNGKQAKLFSVLIRCLQESEVKV